jgi:hypothetical protein
MANLAKRPSEVAMTSQRKIDANKQNAKRSTGPRTESGKLRASRNAVRHGLAAKFGTDEVDIRNIETLAKALAADRPNCPTKAARAAALAQLELTHIRKVRTRSWSALAEAAENVHSERPLDLYERRATSRKRSAFRQLLD